MKIRWEIDEAMILLDALVKVLGGEVRRNDAVSAVSYELRARAILKGVKIDDIFRNYAGIDMQMHTMDRAYTGKENGMTPSKLFEETVELYRNDPSEFHRKLSGFRAETPVKEVFPRYAALLKKNFAEKGFRQGNAIWTARFKNAWKREWGEELTDAPEKIDRILEFVGTTRGARIYPRDEEAEAILEGIVGQVLTVLRGGVSGVCADSIFEKFNRDCTEILHIYTSVELAQALLKKAGKRLFITSKQGRQYFVLGSDGYPKPKDDVVRVMSNYYEPRTFEEIREELWYLPESRIRSALQPKRSIVYTGNGRFFYAPNLPVSERDLERIAIRIGEVMEGRPFMTDSDLYELIQDEFPSVATDTESFGVYGLRQCMSYFLEDKFSFEGSVISRDGENLTPFQIWTEYSRYRDERSLQEIVDFAKQITDGNIYWENILREMVRVSETRFIRRDRINFDVEAIDEILETMCPGSFAPIKNVDLFLLFPEIGGWPWNEFVLESYLFKGSEKFSLVHLSFGRTEACGAIVRKDSSITNYRELAVQALAASTATSSDEEALSFLMKNGYQHKRRLTGITEIRRNAALLREQREREKSHV